MRSGQFYRGKIDGVQKHYESPNLEQLLPTEKLCDLADYFEEGDYSRFFTKERVIARIVVSPAENSDGRQGGTINHTVLYKFDHSIMHESVQYCFDTEQFIREIQQGKRKLKMPQPPELKDSLDYPPPLEWEVES